MYSQEFENNKVLQWSLGALFFAYFIAFESWMDRIAITKEAYTSLQYVCPPYLQSCGEWYVLQMLPHGYSQTMFYMALFALLLWGIYFLSKKRWLETQLLLLPVFVWHVLCIFVLTDLLSSNYEYYLVAFGFILLFLPHKEFFLKLTLVLLYVLSTAAKIHPSWIEGGYFTALRTGLPIFPEWSIPVWTNIVIFMEMIGAWFLLSKNRVLQRSALIFFVCFHLYSGILVLYRYPATVLPFLLILFGPWYRYTVVPLDRRSIAGWVFIMLLFVLQFTPRMIEGDEKLTLEGNKLGLYMFEANHQCISSMTAQYIDGTSYSRTLVSNIPRNRCDPYQYWFYSKELCARRDDVERISWTFDHSINGGPFLRIVDTDDACALEYKPFTHNEWIKSYEDSPEIIGWPVQNGVR